MNKIIRSIITLAAFAAGTSALLAQPAVKLVVVDMAKVYDGFYKAQDGNAKIQDAEQKAQEQVEELNKQGQTLVDEYKELVEQAKSTVLTPEARNKAEMEEKSPAARAARQDAMRRMLADPAATKEFLIKNSMLASLREAAAIE